MTEQELIDKILYADYKSYEKGAYRRGYQFKISFTRFKQLVFRKCSYCRIDSSRKLSKGNLILEVNGVDRINNKEGYIVENVDACCSICNFLKLDREAFDFEAELRNLTYKDLELDNYIKNLKRYLFFKTVTYNHYVKWGKGVIQRYGFSKKTKPNPNWNSLLS